VPSALQQIAARAKAGDESARRKLAELVARSRSEAWRANPVTFAEHLSGGRYQRARHLDFLGDKLSEAAYGKDKRIVVSMPVRHGKSWLTSMWFVVWYLDRWPDRKIILVGHGADFARKWGRRVRNLIRRHKDQLRVRLAPDMSAADAWETTAGGGMITAGIGGQINGEGCHLLLVDDYCKNDKQAMSKPWRDGVKDFWDSTAETRMEPGASCVIVATRWHEDDLIGRLIAAEEEAEAEQLEESTEGLTDEEIHRAIDRWDQVILPAIAEENDPLGREPGEALWPERWPLWRLARKRRSKGAWVWAAIYQQRPAPMDGGFFRAEWLRFFTRVGDLVTYRPTPEDPPRSIRLSSLTVFSVVDLATSQKEGADYLVVGTFGLAPDGCLFLLGVAREKTGGPGIIPLIESQMERWGSVVVWIEAAGFQLSLVQNARKKGLPVRELRADKNKEARALPATAELEAGTVLFDGRAEWWDAFQRELMSFPGGAHDDQVDVLSYAVQIVLDLGAGGIVYGIEDEAGAEVDEWEDDDADPDSLRMPDGPLF
tara:strand:- start:25035 stop:26663 length:1629 start_codon:yes stop_codon:yes gene_type:complete